MTSSSSPLILSPLCAKHLSTIVLQHNGALGRGGGGAVLTATESVAVEWAELVGRADDTVCTGAVWVGAVQSV
jgi:hypothetical protein